MLRHIFNETYHIYSLPGPCDTDNILKVMDSKALVIHFQVILIKWWMYEMKEKTNLQICCAILSLDAVRGFIIYDLYKPWSYIFK